MAAFNRAIGKDGTVGVWHETYLIEPGKYETIYANMPLFGLAAATSHVPRRVDCRRQKTACAGDDLRLPKSVESLPGQPIP